MTEAKGEKGITLLYKTSSLLAQKFIIKEGEKEDVPCAREKINRIKFWGPVFGGEPRYPSLFTPKSEAKRATNTL